MGKVKSIFKLTGKVSDYVFYKLNGKHVVTKAAAKKKGPKTTAQENSAHLPTEFGEASSDGKTLRMALAEECSRLKDRQLYYRVAKLMVALKSEDPGPKSERTAAGGMATAAGREIFNSFSFHKKPGNFPKLLGGGMAASTFTSPCRDFQVFHHRRKKEFTEIVMISGERFLQGVVVEYVDE